MHSLVLVALSFAISASSAGLSRQEQVLRSAVRTYSRTSELRATINVEKEIWVTGMTQRRKAVSKGTLLMKADQSFSLSTRDMTPVTSLSDFRDFEAATYADTDGATVMAYFPFGGPSRWLSVTSDGKDVKAVRTDGPYPSRPLGWLSILQFVGDVSPLVLWLNPPTLTEFASTPDVAYLGVATVSGRECDVVRVSQKWPRIRSLTLKSLPKNRSWMDLFVDKSGHIIRTVIVGTAGVTTVTLSDLEVKEGALPKEQASRHLPLEVQTYTPVPLSMEAGFLYPR